MSGIGSVGSNISWISQFYKSSASCDGSSDATNSSSDDASSSSTQASTDGATTSPAGDLRSQLEKAVTSALDGLDSSATADDALKAVHQAVHDTLQANGITPPEGGAGGGHHHHHHAGGGEGSSSGGGGGGSSAINDLFSFLSSNGSDPTSSDPLIAADGSTDTTTTGSNPSGSNPVSAEQIFAQLFANFPNGSGVDVKA